MGFHNVDGGKSYFRGSNGDNVRWNASGVTSQQPAVAQKQAGSGCVCRDKFGHATGHVTHCKDGDCDLCCAKEQYGQNNRVGRTPRRGGMKMMKPSKRRR